MSKLLALSKIHMEEMGKKNTKIEMLEIDIISLEADLKASRNLIATYAKELRVLADLTDEWLEQNKDRGS